MTSFTKNDIIKGYDNNNKLIIINLNELKSYERLKDANVFKLLFGIHEDPQFTNFPLEQTDNSINLFKDFSITQNDWILFISFIKNGHTPSYLKFKYNPNFYLEAQNEINKLNNICNIFGGILAFDEFYNNFYKELQEIKVSEINDSYNPIKPEDDTKNLYNWTVIDNSHVYNFQNFACTHKEEDGWSASKCYTHGSIIYVYYRKLKNI